MKEVHPISADTAKTAPVTDADVCIEVVGGRSEDTATSGRLRPAKHRQHLGSVEGWRADTDIAQSVHPAKYLQHAVGSGDCWRADTEPVTIVKVETTSTSCGAAQDSAKGSESAKGNCTSDTMNNGDSKAPLWPR